MAIGSLGYIQINYGLDFVQSQILSGIQEIEEDLRKEKDYIEIQILEGELKDFEKSLQTLKNTRGEIKKTREMYVEPEQLEALDLVLQEAPRYQDALLTRLCQEMDRIEDPASRKLVWAVINDTRERYNSVCMAVSEVRVLKAQLERENDV